MLHTSSWMNLISTIESKISEMQKSIYYIITFWFYTKTKKN